MTRLGNKLLDDLKIMSTYHRDKTELNTYYVSQRLIKSLDSYYHDINNEYIYLDNKDFNKVDSDKINVRILKEINKEVNTDV